LLQLLAQGNCTQGHLQPVNVFQSFANDTEALRKELQGT